jgi:hypothetical protein
VQRGTGRLVASTGPALRAGGGVGKRRAAKLRPSGREPEGADGAAAPETAKLRVVLRAINSHNAIMLGKAITTSLRLSCN